jgi:hypothetical protein
MFTQGPKQISVNPFLNFDGFANAPAGPAYPFPTLLLVNNPSNQLNGQTIAARPPWRVAGVDYAVGIDRSLYPTNASLKDPNTILSTTSGASGNNSTHIVTVTGSNVVLDGYDFSLNNGWMVEFSSGTNLTISNCNFAVGANLQTPIWCPPGGGTTVTITKCIVDGGSVTYANGAGAQNGTLSMNARGTTTITYNYVLQAPGECAVISTTNNASGDVWVVKYNVMGNSGMGFDSSLHGDWIQTYNGTSGSTTSMNMDFNVFFQFVQVTSNTTGPRTQGLSLWSAAGNAGLLQNGSVSNNVMIGTGVTPSNTGGPFVNQQQIIVPKNLSGNMLVQNNYFDNTLYTVGGNFSGGAFWLGSDFGSGSPSQGVQSGTINNVFPPTNLFSSNAMPAGNTCLNTGALLTQANGNVHLGSS